MIVSLLIDAKSIKVISGFNLKRMKKIVRRRCRTKISKTHLKTISIIDTPPGMAGHRGVKMFGRPNWRSLWWVGALIFSPNWIKIEKPSESRGSLTIFVQFWWFFSFFNFGWILSLKLNRVVFSLVFQIFYTPGTPWGGQ